MRAGRSNDEPRRVATGGGIRRHGQQSDHDNCDQRDHQASATDFARRWLGFGRRQVHLSMIGPSDQRLEECATIATPYTSPLEAVRTDIVLAITGRNVPDSKLDRSGLPILAQRS
jgi:hypothetical protein